MNPPSYELAFLDEALKEWRKLDNATREQFKAKLAERLRNPKIPSARLHGAKERYKIKLRTQATVLSIRSRIASCSFWSSRWANENATKSTKPPSAANPIETGFPPWLA